MKNYTRPLCAVLTLLPLNSLHSAEEEGWQFALSPLYLWAKNIEGTAVVGGRESALSLDFQDDILDNLESAYAFHLEARKRNLTLYAEYNYAELTPTATATPGRAEYRAEVTFEEIMWEAGALWAFADRGDSSWELLGAVRYQEDDLKLDLLRSGQRERRRRVSAGDDWWQGVVGLRYTFHATDRWSWRLRGDYGYGDSDNESLHATAFLDYRFRDWGSVFGGYRYLDNDYDNGRSYAGGYAFDGSEQGPVLGLNFYF